jgi:hypothetical protein
VEALLARRPGHPDVRITEAAVALDEGEAERALQCLDGAEQSRGSLAVLSPSRRPALQPGPARGRALRRSLQP